MWRRTWITSPQPSRNSKRLKGWLLVGEVFTDRVEHAFAAVSVVTIRRKVAVVGWVAPGYKDPNRRTARAWRASLLSPCEDLLPNLSTDHVSLLMGRLSSGHIQERRISLTQVGSEWSNGLIGTAPSFLSTFKCDVSRTPLVSFFQMARVQVVNEATYGKVSQVRRRADLLDILSQ